MLYENNSGNIPTRGRGNYESDTAKENARLKNAEAEMRVQGGRRLNVSGVLRCLGVSRSGYNIYLDL